MQPRFLSFLCPFYASVQFLGIVIKFLTLYTSKHIKYWFCSNFLRFKKAFRHGCFIYLMGEWEIISCLLLDETDVVAITNSFMNHKPLIMLLFIKCNMFLQLGAVTTGFVHSECTARQKPPVGKRERVFHGFCIVDPQHKGKAIYSSLNYAWHLQLLTIWILAVTLSLVLWIVKHC